LYLRQVDTSPVCLHPRALLEEEKRARIYRVVIRFPAACSARLLPTLCARDPPRFSAAEERGRGLPAKTRVGRRGRGYKIKSSTAPASQQTITPPTTTSNHYPTPPRLFISISTLSIHLLRASLSSFKFYVLYSTHSDSLHDSYKMVSTAPRAEATRSSVRSSR
jgi:hypothetical protein